MLYLKEEHAFYYKIFALDGSLVFEGYHPNPSETIRLERLNEGTFLFSLSSKYSEEVFLIKID